MKKFLRKFKRGIKSLKCMLNTDDYVAFIRYILFLINKNKEILINKKNGGNNNLTLEKSPCNRGDIFLVDFGFGIGSEFRHLHYCVVINVDRNVTIVVPFTSKCSKSQLLVNLGVIPKLQVNNTPPKTTYALIYGIRSISRARLIRPRINGRRVYPKLSSTQLSLIDNSIKTHLTKLI